MILCPILPGGGEGSVSPALSGPPVGECGERGERDRIETEGPGSIPTPVEEKQVTMHDD